MSAYILIHLSYFLNPDLLFIYRHETSGYESTPSAAFAGCCREVGCFVGSCDVPLSVTGKCMCKVELDGNRSRDSLIYALSSSVEAELLLGLQACDQLNLLRRVAVTTASPPGSESIQEDSVAS